MGRKLTLQVWFQFKEKRSQAVICEYVSSRDQNKCRKQSNESKTSRMASISLSPSFSTELKAPPPPPPSPSSSRSRSRDLQQPWHARRPRPPLPSEPAAKETRAETAATADRRVRRAGSPVAGRAAASPTKLRGRPSSSRSCSAPPSRRWSTASLRPSARRWCSRFCPTISDCLASRTSRRRRSSPPTRRGSIHTGRLHAKKKNTGEVIAVAMHVLHLLIRDIFLHIYIWI